MNIMHARTPAGEKWSPFCASADRAFSALSCRDAVCALDNIEYSNYHVKTKLTMFLK